MTSIYALVDPTERSHGVYVGKAVDPLRRFKTHLTKTALSVNTPKADWIRALLRRGVVPQLIVIEVCNDTDWQDAERFYIAYFRSIGMNLLNYTDGGDGLGGIRPETRAKLSAAFRGRKGNKPPWTGGHLSPETRAKMSAAKRPPLPSRRGHRLSDRHREAISKGRRGIVFSDDHRANLRAAWVRRKATPT